MLKKQRNALYIIDDENSENQITFSFLGDSHWRIDMRIYGQKRKDTFIEISKSDPYVFECLERCYNSIIAEYNTENKWQKERYESIWFVDKYNNVVTFYSDYDTLEKANSFSIRKKSDECFELAVYYVSSLEYVPLTNDYGQYVSYLPFLLKLHQELMSVAEKKEEIIPPKVVVSEIPETVFVTKPKTRMRLLEWIQKFRR